MKINYRLAVALVAGIAVGGAAMTAYAAGTFDGTYSGTGAAKGECGVLNVMMTVKDNKVTGTIKGAKGTASISSGTVAADGTAKIKYQTAGATVKFTKDSFAGQFASACGMRDASGKKQ